MATSPWNRSMACKDSAGHSFDTAELGLSKLYVDTRVMTCRRCGHVELYALYEQEHYTAAGRWCYGALMEGVPLPRTADEVVEVLKSLDRVWSGGSFFDGKEDWRSPSWVLP